jgi:hypothetical protein
MQLSKLIGVAAIGLALAVGGSSGALAKAHDQGKADGTQPLGPGVANQGIVAGINVPGIGGRGKGTCPATQTDPPTCGVSATGEDGTYGSIIVRPRVEAGTNGINGGLGPVTNDNAPGQSK